MKLRPPRFVPRLYIRGEDEAVTVRVKTELPTPNEGLEHAIVPLSPASGVVHDQPDSLLSDTKNVPAGSVSDQITGHPPGTPWPDNIRELQARGERDRNNELLLFATGSVALVTASVLFVTGRRERLADRIAVAPAIAHGAAGLAISGGF